MEPFALKTQPKPRTPWLATGCIAIAFIVWQLDIIPRIGAVATGTVRTSEAPPDSIAETDDPSWDAIVDRSASLPVEDSVSDTQDPLRNALASESEPIEIALLEPDSRAMPGVAQKRTASSVQPASFEITDEPDSESPHSATIIAAELAQRLREIDQLYRDDLILEAHAELSQIYWKEPSLRSLIRARIEHTAALIYTSRERRFEEPYLVQPGDTLGAIANRYQVTWQYLANLNRTTPNDLQAGQSLKVLKGPFFAVVDLSDFALTVHCHGWFVHRYRIGIGEGDRTPSGDFVVEEKLENPVWYNPDGGQIDADDPTNPLGEYWLGLGNHIGIHGTIDPDSIGKARSRGCIHLAEPDISDVYHLLGVGSKVLIRP